MYKCHCLSTCFLKCNFVSEMSGHCWKVSTCKINIKISNQNPLFKQKSQIIIVSHHEKLFLKPMNGHWPCGKTRFLCGFVKCSNVQQWKETECRASVNQENTSHLLCSGSYIVHNYCIQVKPKSLLHLS